MVKNTNRKPLFNKHERKKSVQVEFDLDVNSIDVKLVHAPSLKELSNFIPQFASATWCDEPGKGKVFDKLKPQLMDLFFNNKLLPTAYECVNLVFQVTGIEHTTASHLIRHRTLSFSARTHADRDNRDDRYTIPGAVVESEFADEYKKLTQKCVDLYGKMLDTDEISTMDARAILPRSEQTYYFVRGNLKDLMNFIRIRLDVQTQPQTDNILSMLMWREILKVYPMLKDKIDFEQQDRFYVSAAQTDVGHNLFAPAKKNDVFDWHPDDFVYPKHRDEFNGSKYYFDRKQKIIDEITEITNKSEDKKDE